MTSAFNFRANVTLLMDYLIPQHGNYGKCVGGALLSVMISAVLFGHFLFEEKVTDASALYQVASQ